MQAKKIATIELNYQELNNQYGALCSIGNNTYFEVSDDPQTCVLKVIEQITPIKR